MVGQGESAARLAWVDGAKALAITLIVVYHTSGWAFSSFFADGAHPAAAMWRELSVALTPVRIPLFFLVSGLLAAGAVERSWSALARTRILDLLWPFAIWTLLITGPWLVRTEIQGDANWSYAIAAIFFGGAHIWFLPALACFLCIAKLASPVRIPALLVAAAASWVFQPELRSWLALWSDLALRDNLGRIAAFLVWFLLGCYGRSVIMRMVSRPVLLAASGALGLTVVFLLRDTVATAWLAPFWGVVGIAMFLGASAVVTRSSQVARLAEYLAKRTLAIYVGHAFMLEILVIALTLWSRRVPELALHGTVAMVAFVPVTTVALIWASTALYDVATRHRLRVLYQPPARWSLRRTRQH